MKPLIMASALMLAVSSAAPVFAAPDAPAAQAGEHKGGWRHGGPGKEGPLSKLPPEKAQMVREAFQKGREANKDKHEQLKKLHEEQKALMGARDFNRDAYLANAKKIQALRAEMQESRTKTVADIAPKLTPEERTALVDRPHRMGPPPPHGGNPPPPPPPHDGDGDL